MRTLRELAVCSIAMTALACGAAPTRSSDATSESASAIARVHKAKCGACHVRVEPGERTRAQLEDAFTRHRTRVRLSEPQWAQMVDYLAARGATR